MFFINKHIFKTSGYPLYLDVHLPPDGHDGAGVVAGHQPTPFLLNLLCKQSRVLRALDVVVEPEEDGLELIEEGEVVGVEVAPVRERHHWDVQPSGQSHRVEDGAH